MKLNLLLTALWTLAYAAGVSAQIFDNPQNLKVLPDDISAAELGKTMKSFALGTGFRCSSCHMGEEGQALSEYDFSSDEKELKQTARRMLKMVRDINGNHLEFRGDGRIEVQCVTCHRGVNKPEMTADVLAGAVADGGVEGLQIAYRELRGRYYGTHSYDFSDFTLGAFTQSLMREGKTDEARAMLDMVLEDNPTSFNAVFLYGELSVQIGNTQAAEEYYLEAIELNPRAATFIQPKLEELKSAKAEGSGAG